MENGQSKVSNQGCNSEHVQMHIPVAYELEQHRVIELAAYYMAERDGFRCSPVYYWLAAENDVQM
ncbi:hypothetical protein GALL_17910 [mine drainage metagenome]|uniref:Uncharacterized protein n=1 Tax=mine drainage metagenome TaxID=410659 RepID=A0A1J5TMM0_9ZZZZ